MESTKPAWADLVVPDYIKSIPAYVPGKPIAELERELGIPGAVKLASNENPLGPSPLALKAIERHLPHAHIYPEGAAPELRTALASRFGVPEECLVLGNGSDEIIQFVAHLFIQPGCDAVIPANTFSMYRICVQAFGGRVRTVPLTDYRFDLRAMARAVNSDTRLVFLAIPNNPTGTVVSRGEFESFVRDLPPEGLVVVVDEAYREYARDPDCPTGLDYIGNKPPVLVLRTFSKIYGLAGVRVGFGFAEPWLADLLNRVKPPFNVNSVAQVAAVAALEDVEHVRESLDNTQAGMKFLEEELAKMGLTTIPSQANFLMICMDGDAGPIYQDLLREGVIVRHLASFGLERCLRVTIGKPEENQLFINALRKVLARAG